MSRFWKFLTSLTQPPPAVLDPRAINLNLAANEYDSARPNYSPIIFGLMDDSFHKNCKVIADIGAGTGQLTHLLKDHFDSSTKIYAVEPVEKLRQRLRENFIDIPNVEVHGGLSDNLSFIEDNSVDAIFCGGSFHWFATIGTMKEFERMLSGNDSYLMLVWNELLWNDSRFLAEIRQIAGIGEDHHDLIRRKVQRLLSPQNLFDHDIKSFERFRYKELKRTHQEQMTGRLLVKLIMSTATFCSLDIKSQVDIVKQIKACINQHHGSLDTEILIPYSTLVTYAKCNKDEPQL